MSHCTKFDFQYTDERCLRAALTQMGLSIQKAMIRGLNNLKWRVDEYPSFHSELQQHSALASKIDGFNIFMENMGKYFELSVEKHNMNAEELHYATSLSNKIRKNYIKEVAQVFVNKMTEKGTNCLLDQTTEGFVIRFGQLYEKSILIKFDNGRVIEEVQGVKGQSCASVTEALENMLSSDEVDLETEWTGEYYDEPDNGLTIYNMEKI